MKRGHLTGWTFDLTLDDFSNNLLLLIIIQFFKKIESVPSNHKYVTMIQAWVFLGFLQVFLDRCSIGRRAVTCLVPTERPSGCLRSEQANSSMNLPSTVSYFNGVGTLV